MKSNKGQALVEFVIILPVALLLIFSIVDIGRIINTKSELEGIVNDAVTFYSNGKSESEINSLLAIDYSDVDIKIYAREETITITANKKLKPITPGINKIAKDAFDVKESRVIYNE